MENRQFHRLTEYDNCRIVTGKVSYANRGIPFPEQYVRKAVHFAWEMTNNPEAHQREWRSGGTMVRNPAEIFTDVFQGKLAEFGFYDYCINVYCRLFPNIICPEPDITVTGWGVWDNGDFTLRRTDGKTCDVSIKSTKDFGNVMLLETANWDSEGNYIPSVQENKEVLHPDVFVMIRIRKEDDRNIVRTLLQERDEHRMTEYMLSLPWTYDLTGYITHGEFKECIIQNGYIIPQGTYLNRPGPYNRMDASNYYVQAGDLHKFPDTAALRNMRMLTG